MKQFLLGLAGAMLLSANAQAETWGLIGELNGWSDDVELSQVSDNVYSVTLASLQGQFKFRADKDWDRNFGNASSVDDINGNGTLAMIENGANFNASQTLSNVTLTINTLTKELTVSGLASDQTMPESFAPLYLVGEPAGGWSPGNGISMNTTDGKVYTWTGALFQNQYFAFAKELNNDSDWDAFNSKRFGPAYDGTQITEGVNNMSYPQGTAWCVPSGGNYTFSVDIEALTLTVGIGEEVESTWGLIGGFSDWASDIDMTKVANGVYEVTVENFTGEFKFRADHNWATDFGASYQPEITGDGDYPLAAGGQNFSVPITLSKVTFTLDIISQILTVSNYTGVDAVGVDNIGAVRYFNLQGQLVANPSNGVYIRVSEDGCSKVSLGAE